jgi:hypothetical protein
LKKLHTPKLHAKKFLAVPIIVAPLVLGSAGVALAGNPTDPPPPLPPDQIVLNGTCVSAAQVATAAQQALAQYTPGSPPAGLIVNGSWLPVAMSDATGVYVGAGQCAGPQVPSVLPADQIRLTGCVSATQEATAAQDAIDLYAAGDAPAGILVNSNWVPAGIATNAGGYAASNACP